MLLDPSEGDGSDKPDSPDESEPPKKKRKKRRPGAKRPPEDLPRVDIEVLPDIVQRLGTDAFIRIGEAVRETVEKRPASMVVVRVTRPKFIPRDEQPKPEPGPTDSQFDITAKKTTIHIADPLELPIPKGIAGPSLLADTIVRRWQDHLPMHRLESIYKREGLPLARSTICDWHTKLADLVSPLVQAMMQDALESPYLCTDATGVLVQAKERCQSGHFWVLVAPERHVLFQFSKRHDSDAVDALLANYSGYLVADAHVVYDHLFVDGRMIEVGCWSHTRRYFYKALKVQPESARQALSIINALFRIERESANHTNKQRLKVRQAKSKPLVERFFAWCRKEGETVLEDTPLQKGITYALNQQTALSQFLSNGRLPLSNNVSERALRREALGRKNWLFIGSPDGARANTHFVSLLASCQLHQIEPHAYLRDLLCLLPNWLQTHVLDLAPVNWQKTISDPHTQHLLEQNVFRQVSLDAFT